MPTNEIVMLEARDARAVAVVLPSTIFARITGNYSIKKFLNQQRT